MNKYEPITSYFNIKALKNGGKMNELKKIKIHVACVKTELYNYAKKNFILCKSMHKKEKGARQ